MQKSLFFLSFILQISVQWFSSKDFKSTKIIETRKNCAIRVVLKPESLRLQNASKAILEVSSHPSTTNIAHYIMSISNTSTVKNLQGWWFHYIPGQPVQYLTTHFEKKFILIISLNLPWHSLRPFPLILLLVTWEKSLTPSNSVQLLPPHTFPCPPVGPLSGLQSLKRNLHQCAFSMGYCFFSACPPSLPWAMKWKRRGYLHVSTSCREKSALSCCPPWAAVELMLCYLGTSSPSNFFDLGVHRTVSHTSLLIVTWCLHSLPQADQEVCMT